MIRMKKRIVAVIYLEHKKCVRSFADRTVICDDPAGLAADFNVGGCDELLIFDLSVGDAAHEEALLTIKDIARNVDMPIIGAGNISRLEDVKKLLYAGCERVALNFSKQANIDVLKEAAGRFGRKKLLITAVAPSEIRDNAACIDSCASEIILLKPHSLELCLGLSRLPVLLMTDCAEPIELAEMLKQDCIAGLAGPYINENSGRCLALKQECAAAGADMYLPSPQMAWADFTLNHDGMLPVVTQDAATGEVLMVAYMNEEAYVKTLETGVMTYFSRSRSELWVKGATSGHYQYVKSLQADCDSDTLLAKVHQIGAACHTGSHSCFFRPVFSRGAADENPARVLEEVYQVISDRREHPKEGSYTNYLFDKGLDKILKKVGEEATELVIAAKNPNPEEIKYELSDFLYHAMVLMVEKGVTWEEIWQELSDR